MPPGHIGDYWHLLSGSDNDDVWCCRVVRHSGLDKVGLGLSWHFGLALSIQHQKSTNTTQLLKLKEYKQKIKATDIYIDIYLSASLSMRNGFFLVLGMQWNPSYKWIFVHFKSQFVWCRDIMLETLQLCCDITLDFACSLFLSWCSWCLRFMI